MSRETIDKLRAANENLGLDFTFKRFRRGDFYDIGVARRGTYYFSIGRKNFWSGKWMVYDVRVCGGLNRLKAGALLNKGDYEGALLQLYVSIKGWQKQ